MTPGALLLSGVLLVPSGASAQTDVEMLGRIRGGAKPPPGFYDVLRRDPEAFRFSRGSGWIRRGNEVAAARRRQRGLMVDGRARLDVRVQRTVALVQLSEATALSGTLHMPVFPIVFENTESSDIVANVPRSVLQIRLYGTDPAPPYSMHTYYREVSNDQLTINGTVLEWARVPLADSIYEGTSNGLGADSDMPQLISDIVSVWDATVDFGQFDSDGPDGIPNSGDDDGHVDAVVLIHPKVDGSCQNVNPEGEKSIWAHRWSYSNWTGSALVTNDARAGGGSIVVDDYIIQGGQGGDSGCASDEPLAFGLVAHETGHLFGLPDLYDTGFGDGAGIGRWGLMSSGNQQVYSRPAHMTAWTKAQLGWVTEVLIDRDTTIDMSPVVTSDTSYILPIPNTNEYFVLENRQRIGSDSMLINEGLLIWHVDSVLTRLRGLPLNRVNGMSPYAMALVQADGQNDLENGANRGDGGDPFPGSSDNREFGVCTQPGSWTKTGEATVVRVNNINPLAPFGAVRADIEFIEPDPVVIADSTPATGVFGSPYQLQLTASGGIECSRDWQLVSGVLPSGMALTVDGLISGRFNEAGDFPITVRVESGSEADTTSFTLKVVPPVLAVDSVVNELLEISQPLTDDELIYLDLQGNNNQQLDLGDFVEWMRTTGGGTTAEEIAELLRAAAARGEKGGGDRE